MGYMGLGNWGSSDRASDMIHDVIRNLIISLRKGFDDSREENEFNTSGCVNVALIIESGLLDMDSPYIYHNSKEFQSLIKDVREDLKKHLDGCADKYKAQWGDEEGRLEHKKAYKRMMASIDVFMEKARKDYEKS